MEGITASISYPTEESAAASHAHALSMGQDRWSSVDNRISSGEGTPARGNGDRNRFLGDI